MATMFIRHQVADFGKWKQAYDAFGPERQQLGVSADAVYRRAEDGNDVTVTHEFATLEAAHHFVESNELRGVMQEAGVAGEPTVWYGYKA